MTVSTADLDSLLPRFGLSRFRPGQREVIEAVTERTAWTLNNARDIEMAQGLSAELRFEE